MFLRKIILMSLFVFPVLVQAQSLDATMKEMGANFGTLTRQVAKPELNASSIKLVDNLLSLAHTALTQAPALATAIPESERAAFLVEYQKGMESLFTQLDEMRSQLLASKNPEAQATLNKIARHIGESHKRFRNTQTLPEVMKDLKTAYEGLMNLRVVPGKETLAFALQMERAALIATLKKPASLAKIPAEAQGAYLADYKKALTNLAQVAAELQKSLTASDALLAKKIFDQIGPMIQEAHRRFK